MPFLTVILDIYLQSLLQILHQVYYPFTYQFISNPGIIIIGSHAALNKRLARYIHSDSVEKYIPLAIDVILKNQNPQIKDLNQKERVLITKLISNINILCKMNKKEVVDFLKTAPSYQPVLAQLFFQSALNNWKLITNGADPVQTAVVVGRALEEQECVGVQYRVQFTLSSISKKKGVKAIILMVFIMADGSFFRVYFNLPQFEKFRYQIADIMKSIYTIEMKSLF